jgi:hypothetical protein
MAKSPEQSLDASLEGPAEGALKKLQRIVAVFAGIVFAALVFAGAQIPPAAWAAP